MLCEVAAYYWDRGETLCDAMIEMYQKYGYYLEDAKSVILKGVDGAKQIEAIVEGVNVHISRDTHIESVKTIDNYISTIYTDGAMFERKCFI